LIRLEERNQTTDELGKCGDRLASVLGQTF